MFKITRDPIEASLLDANVSAGGIVSFEGRVRILNEGRRVEALEYEAHDALANQEGERIVRQALERFDILEAACVHRVGLLQLGDVAIRVEAASAHRKEAFAACEFIVDEVKRLVPIWKKEHYETGPSEWVGASGAKQVSPESFYHRQMRLAEVGEEGQRKLGTARVLVVGAGGLACSALPYLAAAGVGKIGIVDDDVVEPSNLHRQPLYTYNEVGMSKAVRAAERIRSLNPFVEVIPFPLRLGAENAAEIFSQFDWVLDCTDNFETKFLLNDVCKATGKTLITASLDRFEGQLMVIRPDGPCLRCLWPVAPADGCVGTCAEEGVLGFVPGTMGTLQAAEAIKAILGLETLQDEIAWFDLRTLETRSFRLSKNPACPLCGSGKPATRPSSEESFLVRTVSEGDLIVDIRERYEVHKPTEGVLLMPMSEFDPTHPSFQTAERIVLVCAKGVRSLHLARALRNGGFEKFFSFPGRAHELGL